MIESGSLVEKCRRLVEEFVAQGLLTRAEKRMKLADQCVQQIQKTRRYRYHGWPDVFHLLRADLSEDTLSDIVAEVLKPRKNIEGKSILSSLLQEHSPKVATLFDRADSSQILVQREVVGASSRVDLRVWTSGIPDGDVAIDFEFKVDGGRETIDPVTKEPQTFREWHDLLEFANTKGIAENNVVAFFVTSSGESAACEKFIPIARADLHGYIAKSLAKYSQEIVDPELRAAIAALHWFFLSPYVS